MIANLENEKGDLEKKMMKLSEEMLVNKGDSIELQNKIGRRKKDYEKITYALIDKQDKLVAVNRQLNEIRQNEADVREKLNDVRTETSETKNRKE